jgi:hypothetical protein
MTAFKESIAPAVPECRPTPPERGPVSRMLDRIESAVGKVLFRRRYGPKIPKKKDQTNHSFDPQNLVSVKGCAPSTPWPSKTPEERRQRKRGERWAALVRRYEHWLRPVVLGWLAEPVGKLVQSVIDLAFCKAE